MFSRKKSTWRSHPYIVSRRICRRMPNVKSISSNEPDEAPDTSFFSSKVTPPVPRFCSDLGLHPSGEPRPSPAFQGTLGDSGRKKCARNSEDSSRLSCGPDLSAREGGHRPHRIVFRASSSSCASPSVCCKSLPPTDVQPRGEAS
jgi:hypothetical protein